MYRATMWVLKAVAWVLSYASFGSHSEEVDCDFQGDGSTLYDFSVSGMNENGDEVTLDIKAFNSRHAQYQFRHRGYFATSVKLKGSKAE